MMNITSTVESIHEFIRYQIFEKIDWYTFSSLLARCFNWLLHQALECLLIVAKDVISLISLLLCVAFSFVCISFIKSLKPRYRFCDGRRTMGGRDCHLNQIFSQPTHHSLERVRVVPKTRAPGGGLGNHFITKVQKVLVKISEEAGQTQQHPPMLSIQDIQAVHQQLPWLNTRMDLESLGWLNQSLKTLWPSVKFGLNKFVFDDILKKSDRKETPVECKQLSTKQAKLSVYISSRRKLDQLRRANAGKSNKLKELVNRGCIGVVVYFLKLFFIYFKQFFMDCARSLLKQPVDGEISGNARKNAVDLRNLFDYKNKSLMETANPRSWPGPDRSIGKGGSHEIKVKETKRIKKQKSAPANTSLVNSKKAVKTTNTVLGPDMMAKLRKNRLKLAKLFEKAHKNQQKKEITLRQIKLGHKIPSISGIKYIEEIHDMFHDYSGKSAQMAASDNENMRFIFEVAYCSDKKFCIQVKSIPVLGEVKFTKFSIQLRFLVTLNHTTSELNENLAIFGTPDDVLFPSINHIQVTLVDVPTVDWELERPQRNKTSRDSGQVNRDSRSQNVLHCFQLYLKGCFDPVHLINHSYVKYIVHMVARLTLKWFQPFDIRVGEHLYIKTTC